MKGNLREHFYRWRMRNRLNSAFREIQVSDCNKGLHFEGYTTGKSLSPEGALEELMRGRVIIIPDLLNRLKLVTAVESSLGVSLANVGDIHKSQGLEKLEKLILIKRSSFEVLRIQTTIIRSVARLLGLEQIYVELEPNLRMQPPYKTVAPIERELEARIGSGQMTPHSVHKDSWYFHPKNTLNIWVALSEADELSGLTVLESSQDRYPKTKKQNLIDYGDALASKHLELELKQGDGVIFLAELIHGSIINQKHSTRATLSMRFSMSKPDNHLARQYWYEDMDLISGNLRAIKPRDSHSSFSPKDLERDYSDYSPDSRFAVWDELKITVVDGENALQFPRYCPHKGVDLLTGFFSDKDKMLVCPSHRLRICPLSQSKG
jgi:hypothetical protein